MNKEQLADQVEHDSTNQSAAVSVTDRTGTGRTLTGRTVDSLIQRMWGKHARWIVQPATEHGLTYQIADVLIPASNEPGRYNRIAQAIIREIPDLDPSVLVYLESIEQPTAPNLASAALIDKDDLIALLARFGIKPKIEDDSVELLAKNGGVEGYDYFACSFEFNSDGSFRSVGVWE